MRDVAGKESGGKVRDRIGEEHSGARDLGGVTPGGGSKHAWERSWKGGLTGGSLREETGWLVVVTTAEVVGAL